MDRSPYGKVKSMSISVVDLNPVFDKSNYNTNAVRIAGM
jgi:hypothetical protein